jgi:hypothetical protein
MVTSRNDRLDTTRAFACTLLVVYHVIGGDPQSGLQIPQENSWRILTDAFVNVRMPLFAFLAGVVFAIRPPSWGNLSAFLSGKLRRLALPGIVAITAFAITAHLLETKAYLEVRDFWRAYTMPYAHFWFLQSILVLILFFAFVDVLLRQKFTWLLFLTAFGLSLSELSVRLDLMSINGAIYLAPFFLLGVLVQRASAGYTFSRYWKIVLLLGGGLLFLGELVRGFPEYGSLSADPRSVIGIVIGCAACLIAYFAAPRLAICAFLAPYTFTIYLYHVFFTSAVRRGMHSIGLEDIGLHVLLGTLAGLLFPVVIHRLCVANGNSRRVILGLRA